MRAGGNKTGHAVTGKGTLCPNTQEILLGTAQLQLNADGVREKCEKWELRKRGGLVHSQVVPPGCRRSGETPCKDQLHFREMAICGKWCQERGTESLGGRQLLACAWATTLCSHEHQERVTGGRWGSRRHGDVRAPGQGGTWGTSLSPWHLGLLSPCQHLTHSACAKPDLLSDIPIPKYHFVTETTSFISRPRRSNFVGLQLLPVSSSQKGITIN